MEIEVKHATLQQDIIEYLKDNNAKHQISFGIASKPIPGKSMSAYIEIEDNEHYYNVMRVFGERIEWSLDPETPRACGPRSELDHIKPPRRLGLG